MNKSLPLTVAVLGAAAATGAAPATAAAAATTYKGAKTSFKYGTLDVTIAVSKKKISAISVSYAPTDPRSSQIDEAAVPELKKEALKNQAWDVHSISGASFTTAAFRKSLYSAMGHADLLKK